MELRHTKAIKNTAIHNDSVIKFIFSPEGYMDGSSPRLFSRLRDSPGTSCFSSSSIRPSSRMDAGFSEETVEVSWVLSAGRASVGGPPATPLGGAVALSPFLERLNRERKFILVSQVDCNCG